MTILVVDVGTSSVRCLVFANDASILTERRAALTPSTPAPGLVQFDAALMATTVLDLARSAIADADSVDAVGIATQRSSAVVWDRDTGVPVDVGLGWQDLRTLGACLVHQGSGLRFAPNQAATKFEHLLDLHDPGRSRNLACGTVDSWVAWTLSNGNLHVTDPSNACVTGLWSPDSGDWATAPTNGLRIERAALPAIVDSIGEVGAADALPGAPLLAAILGDQQASMLGQGVVTPGLAKCTFGTGAMLNICGGPEPPSHFDRTEHGTFPLVAWTRSGAATWANEAIMLAAGSNIEWLCDGLGIIDTPADVSPLAESVPDTGGLCFVPDLAGAGTPQWDFGATGALFGMTRGTTDAHIARAVLEGIAHRGADLLDAAEADLGLEAPTLRIDGGLSQSGVFVQALADATGRPIEPSPHIEATALGAAFAAGIATGVWASTDDVTPLTRPRTVIEPSGRADRDRWRDAVERAGRWHEDRSALSF